MTLRIVSDKNRLALFGDLNLAEFRRVLATLHAITRKQRHEEVAMDFRGCRHIDSAAMVAIVASGTKLRAEGIAITIELPRKLQIRNLFMNAGWANHLSPDRFEKPALQSSTHVPLSQFATPTEQGDLVNRVIETLLRSTTRLSREDFGAVEWALSEITDNVLVHSESRVGGFVQLNNYLKHRRVEIMVVDAGLGIPRTLRAGIPSIRSDSEALERAIRDGVTRDTTLGQGNGLYGTYRIAESSGGDDGMAAGDGVPAEPQGGAFFIHSGNASLAASRGQLSLQAEAIPFSGTLVVASMDYSRPDALANALRFGGERYAPTDLIELQYEMNHGGEISIDLAKETPSFGSRNAGLPVRTKIRNLCRMGRDVQRISIDLSNVPLVSSSFADEVFGKLFVDLGPTDFMSILQLKGANETVKALIDRAIVQRSRALDSRE